MEKKQLQYRTEAHWEPINGGRIVVERFCENVCVDRYTTTDLRIRRKHNPGWSRQLEEAANTEMGTTCPDPTGQQRLARVKRESERQNLLRMLGREDVCESMKRAMREVLARDFGTVITEDFRAHFGGLGETAEGDRFMSLECGMVENSPTEGFSSFSREEGGGELNG